MENSAHGDMRPMLIACTNLGGREAFLRTLEQCASRATK
jgi:hypothetical protein